MGSNWMLDQDAASAAQAEEQAATCAPARVQAVPGVPEEDMGCIPLLDRQTPARLTGSFQAAPQFAEVPLETLFRERRGRLQVIFLTQSDYYARQAALYLASLAWQERCKRQQKEEDDFWAQAGLTALLREEENQPLQQALTLVTAAALDPSLKESGKRQGTAVLTCENSGRLQLARLDTPAILVHAPSGSVLTAGVMRQLLECGQRDPEHLTDLFIALRPEQVDLEFLEELRFTYGFHVCRVGQPDQDYLVRFLQACIEELYDPMGTRQEGALWEADLTQVVEQARRVRGERFCETDLESLVYWAVQRQCSVPLKEQDLTFEPFQDQKSGWKELTQLVGLEEVKRTLRRRLAAAALEDRRRQRGRGGEPMCRNLAFSGPPGTGKSVTARLAARILREEGRGTGRFVEAGREQLIGGYLGQTSHMVAGLFRQAKGGVLFVDEAGALLDNSQGQDSYAAEAVNALVRHMELEPETTVIFATYPGEMERLLDSNPGLSSRVAQVLEFPGYDDGALWDIFQTFSRKEGYTLPEGAREVCHTFFTELRRRKGENFGNGREARRLFQGAVEEMALAVVEEDREECLTLADLEAAARRLLVQPVEEKRTIGF